MLSGLHRPYANSSTSIKDSVVCPTGNCTFGTALNNGMLRTLTMCHACRDISHVIKKDVKLNRYYLSEEFGNARIDNLNSAARGQLVNIVVKPLTPAEPFPDGPWKQTSILSIIGLAHTFINTTYGNTTSKRFAFECGLRPCVKAFSASMTNGVYTEIEDIGARQYLHKANQFINSSSYFETVVDTAPINNTWASCIPATNQSATHFVAVLLPEGHGHQTATISPDPRQYVWHRPNCVYRLGLYSQLAIGSGIKQIMNNATMVRAFKGYPEGSIWFKRVYKQANMTMHDVDQFVDGLTTSIGAEIRKNGGFTPDMGGGPNKDVEFWRLGRGHVRKVEPCIRVKWPFLSFLAIIFVLEAAFFVVVIMVHSRSHWSLGWKSLTLPLLFQSIRQQDEDDADKHSDGGYSTRIKKSKAILVQVDDTSTWEFQTKLGGVIDC